ncbi:MAG: hypothetical protein HYZ20_02400 [Burkholderiales bacterium]|nr:hypothetical protein [Burkholderiales bacterium]
MDQAQREPVRVLRHDRVVSVMVSAQDYEAMRAFYADRLAHTLDATSTRRPLPSSSSGCGGRSSIATFRPTRAGCRCTTWRLPRSG